MRTYIRHPANIPVQIEVESEAAGNIRRLANVSHGGLAFNSAAPIAKGSVIRLIIDAVDPVFAAQGIVTHAHREQAHYVIGIEFIHRNDLFVARMVEQICHIEQYKREVAANEGRQLSGQEAATEWIRKYANSFPRWGT